MHIKYNVLVISIFEGWVKKGHRSFKTFLAPPKNFNDAVQIQQDPMHIRAIIMMKVFM